MDDRPSVSARLLAPAALIVGVIALIVVFASSGVVGGGDDKAEAPKKPAAEETTADTQAETRESTTKSRADRLPQDTYTVKTNDTLGAIASKTGISVERLQELNPDVDAQQLVSGQKLKLRE